MGWHLCPTRALSEPILNDCQLDLEEQISIVFQSKYTSFIEKEELENITLQWWPFCRVPRWANMIAIPPIISYANSNFFTAWQYLDHSMMTWHIIAMWNAFFDSRNLLPGLMVLGTYCLYLPGESWQLQHLTWQVFIQKYHKLVKTSRHTYIDTVVTSYESCAVERSYRRPLVGRLYHRVSLEGLADRNTDTSGTSWDWGTVQPADTRPACVFRSLHCWMRAFTPPKGRQILVMISLFGHILMQVL